MQISSKNGYAKQKVKINRFFAKVTSTHLLCDFSDSIPRETCILCFKLFKKFWEQYYIIAWNEFCFEFLKHFKSMKKVEYLVWWPVIQLFSSIRIVMVHH